MFVFASLFVDPSFFDSVVPSPFPRWLALVYFCLNPLDTQPMLHIRRVFALSPFAALALLVMSLSACSLGEYLTPYRIDVRQGNYVSQNMLAQLTPGMTQDQVRYVMGSPLLIDPFHKDRWDYVYRLSPGYGDDERRRITVLFKEGKLTGLQGDVVAAGGKPTGSEPVVPRVIDIGSAADRK